MPERDTQRHWNRDDNQKPGSPPRPAQEPKGSEGSEGSATTSKTMTDAATGAPQPGRQEPNQSGAEDTP